MAIVKKYERKLQTVLGLAQCDLIWIGDSTDEASEFHCWIFETNESWWFPQPLVRAIKSMSVFQRGISSEIMITEEHLKNYKEHILRHKKSPFYERMKNVNNQ